MEMELTYEIRKGDTISRWNLTGMQREPYRSPKKTFDAPVNMEESYVQVVYPVREAFWKEERIKKAARYDGEYEFLYFPFENNRVDLSTFIHTPHYISVNGKAGLRTQRGGRYPFRLCTCGGVKIWVNGKEQALFAPYTRNIPGNTRIELELEEGDNEIKVYADELAERDVFFYFELRYEGDMPLTGTAETKEDPEEILRTEAFLRSCWFEKDMYTDGQVKLFYDRRFLKEDTPVFITMRPFGTGMQPGDVEYVERTAKKEADCLVMTDTKESPIRISRVSVCCKVGQYMIPRNLFVGIIPKERISPAPAASIGERKKQALQFLAEHGEPGFPKVISILEACGRFTDEAEKSFDMACRKIEAHEDCADFSLTPFSLLKTRYSHLLSKEKEERIRNMVLNFRYWIDEPGDDVMWYFSENHAFLFHCSQYLWGWLYPDEVFAASGRTGREQYAIGKKRVEAWFADFFAYGFAEWNSATYIPIDLIGFFSLYLNAPDETIKEMAKRALDETMKLIAWNSFKGVMNATYGRTYEENIKTRIQTEPSFVNWISYGEGYATCFGNASSLYAVSDYEPEDYAGECRMEEDEGAVLSYCQGIGQVSVDLYRTSQYLTAGVRQFKPFRHGHQQHLMHVVFGKEKPAVFYVNHPGERLFSGENRPSYWAGNGTMPWIERYRNLTVMLFDTDQEELVHWIHAYAPLYEYDESSCEENWFFARSGDGYLGCWFSNPFAVTETGANTGKELISQGLTHGIVVKCGSKAEFGSYEAFRKAMGETKIFWDGGRSLSLEDCQYGKIQADGNDGFWVNGVRQEKETKKELILAKEKLVSYS